MSVIKFINENKKEYIKISDKIWQYAELSQKEVRSARLQMDALSAKGFNIKKSRDCQNAFIAEYGNGRPVIGLLGEYDALPGLSQEKKPFKKPIKGKESGHGCGHNLLGAGAMFAAVSVKEAMEEEGFSGKIRYYGCPAEEDITGKIIMVKEGLFNDVDICLTWHPDCYNSINLGGTQAMNSFKLIFKGIASHAAGDPFNGRSALDAVELTDIGSNYLREHIIKDASLHYVITKGGIMPNIVPDLAEVWYFVRAPKREAVEEIYERVLNIARGAALMTDTSLEINLITGCYNFLNNDVLNKMLWNIMEKIELEKFTIKDKDFAKEMTGHFNKGQREEALYLSHLDNESYKYLENKYLCDIMVPPYGSGVNYPGSTDLGDVSWVVPTAKFITACFPLGVSPHSWQVTASSGMHIGYSGMVSAAKILAVSCIRLFKDRNIINSAKDEFKQKTKKKKYKSPIGS